jgi:hypothetical protein
MHAVKADLSALFQRVLCFSSNNITTPIVVLVVYALIAVAVLSWLGWRPPRATTVSAGQGDGSQPGQSDGPSQARAARSSCAAGLGGSIESIRGRAGDDPDPAADRRVHGSDAAASGQGGSDRTLARNAPPGNLGRGSAADQPDRRSVAPWLPNRQVLGSCGDPGADQGGGGWLRGRPAAPERGGGDASRIVHSG